MIRPDEVKSNYNSKPETPRLEKNIDQCLAYYPGDDTCFAYMQFNELSASDFKVLTKYSNAGYDVSISALSPDKVAGKNRFFVKFSYDFKE